MRQGPTCQPGRERARACLRLLIGADMADVGWRMGPVHGVLVFNRPLVGSWQAAPHGRSSRVRVINPGAKLPGHRRQRRSVLADSPADPRTARLVNTTRSAMAHPGPRRARRMRVAPYPLAHIEVTGRPSEANPAPTKAASHAAEPDNRAGPGG